MDKVETRTLQPLFFDDDDELTPITCIRCGANMLNGVGADGINCATCKRRSLTPSQHAISKVRVVKTSQQIQLYRSGAAEMAGKLERKNTILSKKLAEYFRRLESEFATWQSSPPTREVKDQKINHLINLSAQAYTILDNKNAR